jgi:regulator of ribonuclease activity A
MATPERDLIALNGEATTRKGVPITKHQQLPRRRFTNIEKLSVIEFIENHEELSFQQISEIKGIHIATLRLFVRQADQIRKAFAAAQAVGVDVATVATATSISAMLKRKQELVLGSIEDEDRDNDDHGGNDDDHEKSQSDPEANQLKPAAVGPSRKRMSSAAVMAAVADQSKEGDVYPTLTERLLEYFSPENDELQGIDVSSELISAQAKLLRDDILEQDQHDPFLNEFERSLLSKFRPYSKWAWKFGVQHQLLVDPNAKRQRADSDDSDVPVVDPMARAGRGRARGRRGQSSTRAPDRYRRPVPQKLPFPQLDNSVSTADLYDHYESIALVPCLPQQQSWRHFGGCSRFCGVAVTVQCYDDNSKVRSILETPVRSTNSARTPPPRVLIIDGGASNRCALLGDKLAALAVEHQWAGIIVHGCVRDSVALAQFESLGVIALGTTPRKTVKRDTGVTTVPVNLGDIVVHPNDYVFVDDDGILVLPSNQLT